MQLKNKEVLEVYDVLEYIKNEGNVEGVGFKIVSSEIREILKDTYVSLKETVGAILQKQRNIIIGQAEKDADGNFVLKPNTNKSKVTLKDIIIKDTKKLSEEFEDSGLKSDVDAFNIKLETEVEVQELPNFHKSMFNSSFDTLKDEVVDALVRLKLVVD